MQIATAIVRLHAPWVHSLKEKRMIVKSIIAKVQNKFNVSIAEVAEMDTHQIIEIGMSTVANKTKQAQLVIDHVIDFIDNHCEAEVIKITKELY